MTRRGSETELWQHIRDVLNKTGRVRLYRNCQAARGKVRGGLGIGSPDLVGHMVGSGQSVYLEIKRPGEHLSEAQDAWLDNALDDGCIAGVAHSLTEAAILLGIASW
jgi:VRR-NUC domain